jgi:alpha-tubulin suppressor-like RCC1 family protein
LAVTSTGAVLAWGFNADGELGNGTTTDSNTPVAVNALAIGGITAIAGGGQHSLATGRRR